MGAKLDTDNEKVTWRIRSDDLAYLRAIFDGNRVNAVVRDLIHLYVERMMDKAGSRASNPQVFLGELYADNELEGMHAEEE